MKLNFAMPDDNNYHQFCPECHSEHINKVSVGELCYYKCDDCQGTFPRLIVVDPKVKWWVDEISEEYWHESVGIFLFNKNNEALFFKRVMYPFVYTIPAGHFDVGETVEEGIKRELFEETGIKIDEVKLFAEEDVLGDECRRGADNHRWHLFTAHVEEIDAVKINDEGGKPIWMSLEKALTKELTVPVKYFIEKFGDKLFI